MTVRGEGVAAGRPDLIVVALELSAVREMPAEAYDDVARRSTDLEGLCDELAIDHTARSTAGVGVQEHHEYDERGRPQPGGYVASNRLHVRLADPALVGRLLREAVTRADARISGPWWRTEADNPARIDACRLAAEDAQRKAVAYAGALGRALGDIVEVREPGTSPTSGRPLTFAAIDHHEIPIDPGELDVRASVEVTFALEPA